MRYRAQRKRSRIPTVALVGYTNAGKSTLLNTMPNQTYMSPISSSRPWIQPHGAWNCRSGYQALFTDTVGFIQVAYNDGGILPCDPGGDR